MKRVVFAMLLLCLLSNMEILAQSTRKQREEAWREARERRRAEAKALEAIRDSIGFAEALTALQNGNWVLEADNVVFRNGLTKYVSPNTNYVAIKGGEGTVQTAFNNFIYSPNGLGGVTVEGDVSDMRVQRDKEGNVYYNFSIFGGAISATLNLSLTEGTNEASVYISPNFNGNTLIMYGRLYPYDKATIFQGTTSW